VLSGFQVRTKLSGARAAAAALVVSLLAPAIGSERQQYEKEIEAWRAERVAKLTAPDGWMTLVGLHFLRDGANTVGSAKDNTVVLTKGPAHLGTVTVERDGKINLEVAPHADVLVDGQMVRHAELRWSEPKNPTLVTFGTATLFAIDRAGKKALRIKDTQAEPRSHFVGLDYFPIDPAWRITARWIPFERSRLMPITSMLGQIAPEPIPGKAVFERDGKTFELLPIDEGPDAPLFFVISDSTSGHETYGACRFLYVARPAEGETTIVLDFNHAENPPCAFTAFSTCPLPPKENRFPFAIKAGEKKYRGGHE
jgi:uncharacterized protein (DUF1684 family)